MGSRPPIPSGVRRYFRLLEQFHHRKLISRRDTGLTFVIDMLITQARRHWGAQGRIQTVAPVAQATVNFLFDENKSLFMWQFHTGTF